MAIVNLIYLVLINILKKTFFSGSFMLIKQTRLEYFNSTHINWITVRQSFGKIQKSSNKTNNISNLVSGIEYKLRNYCFHTHK